MFSVTDKGVPVRASKEFARKVRQLARDGGLDWLLQPRAVESSLEVGSGEGKAAALALSVPCPDSDQYVPSIQGLDESYRMKLWRIVLSTRPGTFDFSQLTEEELLEVASHGQAIRKRLALPSPGDSSD